MRTKRRWKRKTQHMPLLCVANAGYLNSDADTFWQDKRGIVTTETIIMIAVVAIVAVTVFQIMNTLLPALFREVIERITQMVTGRIIP